VARKEIKCFADLRRVHLLPQPNGRCSSLGFSGMSSGCPTTTHVGTPASADTDLCPASHMTMPLYGRLTIRVAVIAGELCQAGRIAVENRSRRDTVGESCTLKIFVRKRARECRHPCGNYLRHADSAVVNLVDKF